MNMIIVLLLNLFDERYLNKELKTLNYVFIYVVPFNAHIILSTCMILSSTGYLDFRTEKKLEKYFLAFSIRADV